MATERINITQPAEWWVAFRAQADAEGLTLSQWLGQCGRAGLPKSVDRKLADRPAPHRPTTPMPDATPGPRKRKPS